MTLQIDVPQLYRGTINVWVEDPVSAAWFNAVWSDRDIRILTAGGHTAVEALTRHAESNISDWSTPKKTFQRFVLPVHEVENLLLDSEAMANCTVNNTGKSAEDIEDRMNALAVRQVPLMSCRATLTELRHRVLDDFPSHPGLGNVPDLDAAEEAIVKSPWFKAIATKTSQAATSAYVQKRLQHFEQQYQADLTVDRWKQTFSGKELFRDATSFFYQASKNSGQSRDVDAAKAIAAWQVANARVPIAATDLRIALRQRVGI
jgi:hypothetical protein